MTTKLYRSQTNKVVAGVCGGLGEYLNLDAMLVRLFFVLLALASMGGLALAAYMILWVMVPYPSAGEAGTPDTVHAGAEEIAAHARTLGDDLRGAMQGENRQAGLIVGGGLVFLGFVFLAHSLNLWWLNWFNLDMLWPFLLIAAGAALIWRRTSEGRMTPTEANTSGEDRS
jgi:phage shock protein C